MEIASLQTGPLDVNTYIVPLAGQAVLVIDPAACAFSGDEKSIVNYLDERDLVPVGILLTHGHFDHVCGVKELRKSFAQIPIAIHKGDAECLGANSARAHEENLGELGFDENGLFEDLTDLPSADFFLEEGDTLDKFFSAEYIIAAFTGDVPPDVEAVFERTFALEGASHAGTFARLDLLLQFQRRNSDFGRHDFLSILRQDGFARRKRGSDSKKPCAHFRGIAARNASFSGAWNFWI